jgi:hypothetical protein
MNEKLLRTLAFGVAAAAAAVILAPSVAQAASPVVRRGMKSAFVAYMRGREAVAGFMEMVEDAYAEATADLKQEAEAMAAAESAVQSSEPNVSSGRTGVAKKGTARS